MDADGETMEETAVWMRTRERSRGEPKRSFISVNTFSSTSLYKVIKRALSVEGKKETHKINDG
ncbi:unnamed protein product [Eruca vesicaria subsp. sativa]|uniref:Uncharacterized protein n=1 Tax=Eruca vesicaria subsp. sativa TaxID=29727 RepID=A0ABC8L6I6_ERUVS|nr:unnamed protein product [Eruca vesicaria subsp. sativa]